jgi:hypothetical protein
MQKKILKKPFGILIICYGLKQIVKDSGSVDILNLKQSHLEE